MGMDDLARPRIKVRAAFSRYLFAMPESVAPIDVFNAILAGSQQWEVSALLQELAAEDRQNLLCTVCAMRCEIAGNCRLTGAEVSALPTAECPLFIHGVPTCSTERRPALSPVQKTHESSDT